jgi:hypothetical protein
LQIEIRWKINARNESAATLLHLKQDVPKFAREINRKVKKMTRILEQFPFSGQSAVWAGDVEVREFFIRQYRLVYRTKPDQVLICAFVPAGTYLRL